MPVKKILMIVAPRNFRDEEFFTPKRIFEAAGLKVETASSALGIAYGKFGGQVMVDYLLEQVEVANYRAVIFVGGPGVRDYFTNPEIHTLIQEAVEQKLLLGAICSAPVILARAGILKGKKATVWSSPEDQTAIQDLMAGGARYLPEDVVIDRRLITARGPEAAEGFAQAILKNL